MHFHKWCCLTFLAPGTWPPPPQGEVAICPTDQLHWQKPSLLLLWADEIPDLKSMISVKLITCVIESIIASACLVVVCMTSMQVCNLGGEKMQTAIITPVTNATIRHLDDRTRSEGVVTGKGSKVISTIGWDGESDLAAGVWWFSARPSSPCPSTEQESSYPGDELRALSLDWISRWGKSLSSTFILGSLL